METFRKIFEGKQAEIVIPYKDGKKHKALLMERKYKILLKYEFMDPFDNIPVVRATGDAKNIIKFLTSKDYGIGLSEAKDLYPELF